MDPRGRSPVRTLALALVGIGLATSAWAVPGAAGVDLVHPTTTHGLLATMGLLGLVFGGRHRDRGL